MTIHTEYMHAANIDATYLPEATAAEYLPIDVVEDRDVLVLSEWSNNAVVLTGTKGELLALAQRIRDAVAEDAPSDKGFPVSIQDGTGAVWESWTDGRAVGYKITRGDRVEYLYLVPSSDDTGGQSNAFIYQGPIGQVGNDDTAGPYHYVVLDKDS